MRIHPIEGVLASLRSGLTMRASMRPTWTRVCIALVLVAVTAAQGETLYERDGITLEGSVRLVHRASATCQVLEEFGSPRDLRGDQGRPRSPAARLAARLPRVQRLWKTRGPADGALPYRVGVDTVHALDGPATVVV